MTRRYIVEYEQNADFPNQNFFIKLDRNALSGNTSDIVDTNGYAEPYSQPDDKRHMTYSYRLKTFFIESISWQWLYAKNLLVAYELFLTTSDIPLSSNPYSWISVATVIAVGWLLKSDWNPYSSLFNPIKPQEASQNPPFAISAMMAGSEHAPQQGQPSESSGQKPPHTPTQIKGYFFSLLYSDSDDGNEDPEQHSHTLGLNCYISPCNSVCQFRQSSNPYNSGALIFEESSTDHTKTNPEPDSCPSSANTHHYRYKFEDGVAIDGVAIDGVATDGVVLNPMGAGAADPTHLAGQAKCNAIIPGKDGQQRQCGKVCKNARALASHRSKYHSGKKTCNYTVTGEDGRPQPCGLLCQDNRTLYNHKNTVHIGQKTCGVTVVGEDGQQRPCGKVSKNAQALSSHKSAYHTGQKICDLTVLWKDGQLRPCGQVFKASRSLSFHKNSVHSEKKICKFTVIGDNGQSRPCGTVSKNAEALWSHKNNYHTGEKTCGMTVLGEDGQQQACGKVFKNLASLSSHKSGAHTGKKTCLTVVEKAGLLRPCGKVCNSARALSSHKSNCHSGQKTCELTLVDKDGQPQPCGKVCNSARVLSSHKSNYHSGQKTCELTLVDKAGQPQPCGKVCKNAQALSNHKKIHRKRKSVNVNLDDRP
ncbi:hypothetical protein [Endozoicomonas sp. 8E]|uniref:hypothetical protein n=1 Tax=Endozoicomonas sp. 8E TaxID=3035692 RepID=UPI0029391391|nr:hypothetical protein [Endozoicomonas sp. 8E]WOG26929.1 hypothetical protein P6910_20625 [Endozoicomonas sp. 8E]